MTLIWPDIPAKIVTDQPRLHALVIGVANYPHLGGGAGPLAQDPLGLGQVTTPDFTARAMVDWLQKANKNPACPLGSLELLLSSPPGTPPIAEPATMNNIAMAVTRWEQRCASNSRNSALFYFCGHGLAKDDQFLLPEDFGNPAYGNPWVNCIDFDSLRVGMAARCKAETQIFFIDACRETPFGMLTQVNVSGQGLIGGQGFGVLARNQAVYYATTEGKQAYGPANDKTYFAQAVIHCLEGLASANTQGFWSVDTFSLSAALGRVMEHFASKFGQPLAASCHVSGRAVALHRPDKAKVLTSIQCSNPGASALADIELRCQAISHRSALADPKPLLREVEPGDWEVVVSFPGGQFPNSAPLRFTLMPPIFEGVEYP